MEWKDIGIGGWEYKGEINILLWQSYHQWNMFCILIQGTEVTLDIPHNSTPEQAQEKALEMVRNKLESLLKSIS